MFLLPFKASYFAKILNQRPQAEAALKGSGKYPKLMGNVTFYRTTYGVLVCASISGLPKNREDPCKRGVFGFHIHEGTACAGNETDPFADAKSHYNPTECPHPAHAGDLPPLFENNGYAYNVFLTNRFTVEDVIGRAVIIHSMPDDFTTQPAGNSGEKIGCGIIRGLSR